MRITAAFCGVPRPALTPCPSPKGRGETFPNTLLPFFPAYTVRPKARQTLSNPPKKNPWAVADCPFHYYPINAIIPIDGVAEHKPSAPSEGLCQSHCVWRSGVLAPAALGPQPTVNPGHTCLQPARLPGLHQRHLFPLRLICSPQLFDSGRRISGRGWWAAVGVVFSASVSVFFEEWQLCRRVRSRS